MSNLATLTRGMLAPSTQGGHLLAVPERVAARLGWFPLQFVAVTVVSAVVNQLASALELTVPMSVATDAAMTVLLAGVLANALRTGNAVDIFWRRTQQHAAPALTTAPLWVSIAIGVIWLVLLVSVLATLVGYIALGSFLVKQTAWMIVVAGRGDRSTVIVPNSEFITKSVRNVTYASALGLVQIKLPLPLNVDVERVRHELLQSLKAHHDVLDNPAPSVMLDGVDGGNLIVNATAFVRSPRVAYGVRSDLLFDVLGRLKRADIA